MKEVQSSFANLVARYSFAFADTSWRVFFFYFNVIFIILDSDVPYGNGFINGQHLFVCSELKDIDPGDTSFGFSHLYNNKTVF